MLFGNGGPIALRGPAASFGASFLQRQKAMLAPPAAPSDLHWGPSAFWGSAGSFGFLAEWESNVSRHQPYVEWPSPAFTFMLFGNGGPIALRGPAASFGASFLQRQKAMLAPPAAPSGLHWGPSAFWGSAGSFGFLAEWESNVSRHQPYVEWPSPAFTFMLFGNGGPIALRGPATSFGASFLQRQKAMLAPPAAPSGLGA